MNPLTFPRRLTIYLTDPQRGALLELATAVPHKNDTKLLDEVLSRGISAMLVEEKERDCQLRSQAKRPFPAPSVLFKRRQQEKLLGSDIGVSDGPQECEESAPPTEHRHVERYMAAPVSERLRQRLEDYLSLHPDMGEEEALTTLLDRGLDQSEQLKEAGQTVAAQKAEKQLRLAERLYVRALRRCET